MPGREPEAALPAPLAGGGALNGPSRVQYGAAERPGAATPSCLMPSRDRRERRPLPTAPVAAGGALNGPSRVQYAAAELRNRSVIATAWTFFQITASFGS